MPTYEYRCQSCGAKVELFQKITEEPAKICPTCHKETLVRGPGGGIGIAFSGTGFYATDYKSNEPPSSSSGGSCCPCGKNTSCN